MAVGRLGSCRRARARCSGKFSDPLGGGDGFGFGRGAEEGVEGNLKLSD